jgi:hypothetical protein
MEAADCKPRKPRLRFEHVRKSGTGAHDRVNRDVILPPTKISSGDLVEPDCPTGCLIMPYKKPQSTTIRKSL